MRTTATRVGLLGALAAILVAGWPAEATETPPMTKQEASAFKKEIAAKLKAFEAEIRFIDDDLARAYKDAIRETGLSASAFNFFEELAEYQRSDARTQFLDALRACLDAANAEDPNLVDAGAGSIVQVFVAKANAALAKGAAAVDKEAQKVQAAARNACEPVTILRDTPVLELNVVPPGTTGSIVDQHRLEAVIGTAILDGKGFVGVVGSIECRSPHAFTEGCGAESVTCAFETSAGTTEVECDIDPTGFIFRAALVVGFSADDRGRSCKIEVVPVNGEGGPVLSDVDWISCPPGEAPPPAPCSGNSGTLNGSPYTIDTLFDGNRIRFVGKTTLALNYIAYPYVAGGEVYVTASLEDGGPTSGEVTLPVIIGPDPIGQSFARVSINGVNQEGTLGLEDVALVLFDGLPDPFAMAFENLAGTGELHLCVPQEGAPLVDATSLSAAPPPAPRLLPLSRPE